MERERLGPELDGELFWDENDSARMLDGDGAHVEPPAATTPAHAEPAASRPHAPTVRRSGRASSHRIGAASPSTDAEVLATPAGAGNPMRDPKVQNELHHVLPDESNVDFPYTATVTTVRDPLRLRATASLGATIVTHLPKGAAVNISGRSMNHFRPVTWVDPANPGHTWSGWAFTSYLSAPRLKAAPAHAPAAAPVHVATVTPAEVHGEEEPVHAVPAATTLTEVHLRAPDHPIANTDTAIAERVNNDVRNANGPSASLTSGLHYKDQYRQALIAAGRGNEWDRHWDQGYTASSLWRQPFEAGDPFTFTLKEGATASEALRQWIAGLTVSDCTTVMVAFELDAVRAIVGDALFDRCFGPASGQPKLRRLVISQRLRDTPLYELMRFTDGARAAATTRGTLGHRPVKAGEWYYFYNHPDYTRKHPGGPWRGENALCLGEEGGKQMWSGLGASSDEEGLLRGLLEHYNAPRDAVDDAWLVHNYVIPENYPAEYRAGFVDRVDIDAVVEAQKQPPPAPSRKPPSVPAVAERAQSQQQAGLDVSTGMALSTEKLAELIRMYGEEDLHEAPASHPATAPVGDIEYA